MITSRILTFLPAVLFIQANFVSALNSQDLPGSSLPAEPSLNQENSDSTDKSTANKEEVVNVDAATVKALTDVVKSNIHAVTKRNIAMAMNTIHPESPTKESSRDMMTYIFARLQLRYTIQKMEVIKVDEDEAKVEVLQVTQKLSGNAAFRDNRVKVLHTLKRDGRAWKIYSSEALLIEYLRY